MSVSAVEKLRPSRLSDQLETLNTDVDLSSLQFSLDGHDFPIADRILGSKISRTIDGASSLTLTVDDADRTLLRSGYLPERNIGYIGKGLDVEIDGLWFRLWAHQKQGDQLVLGFIDREVAILKDWPPQDQPATWYRVMPAAAHGELTRFVFAQRLIDDVKATVPIRFVCPPLQSGQPPTDPQTNPSHGFPSHPDVSVKLHMATTKQLTNIEAVLNVGDEMCTQAQVSERVRRTVLICSVACITQESDAGLDLGTNPKFVGLFQQNADDGWPATGDPATDAAGFFAVEIDQVKRFPNLGIGQLVDLVQNSGLPKFYEQWSTEAAHTVDQWLGNVDPSTPAAAIVQTNVPDPTKGQFIRGHLETPTAAQRKHKAYVVETGTGNKVVVREDNWTCLTRLAAEIGYRAFMVSGTAYMVDDYWLFHRKVTMELAEDDDGVDNIDYDATQGKPNLSLNVSARVDRWKSPPGGVAAVTEMGPMSGRWLTATIERSLTDPAATITLKKPVASIPESAAPEHGAGQTSGTQVLTNPNRDPRTADTGPGNASQRVQIAAQLLKQYQVSWFDDNGKGLAQIQTVARGEKLTNVDGTHVDLDTKTMRVILWLISQGYIIGTFAWCTDHGDDGLKGHAGGHAVDISSINGVPINRFDAGALTLSVATLLHNLGNVEKPNATEVALAPRQLICGGYGGQYDPIIAALSIPSAAAFDYADSSGRNVLRDEHTNHIHVGY